MADVPLVGGTAALAIVDAPIPIRHRITECAVFLVKVVVAMPVFELQMRLGGGSARFAFTTLRNSGFAVILAPFLARTAARARPERANRTGFAPRDA
jgi:hypothetical protein